MNTSVSRTRFHRSVAARLSPLMLALAVGQAYGADVQLVGPAGAAGQPAAPAGQHGGNGGTASLLYATLGPNADASNALTLFGGGGGSGGAGAEDDYFSRGGNGGGGGAADGATLSVASSGLVPAVAQTLAYGGAGGTGGNAKSDHDCSLYGNCNVGTGGAGGNGGSASSASVAVASGAADVLARATAIGGNGGEGALGATGGNGGGATANAYGRSDTGAVMVLATVTGGDGARALTDPVGPAISAGAGASVQLINAVAGTTLGALSLTQNATGGNSGAILSDWGGNGTTWRGGNAVSTLTLTDAAASSLSGSVRAQGGNGGGSAGLYSWSNGSAGGDGYASLTLSSTRTGASLQGMVTALGGAGGVGTIGNGGGDGGAGGAALSLSGLDAATGMVSAYGGQGAAASYAYGDFLKGGNGGAGNAAASVSAVGNVSASATAVGGDGGRGGSFTGPGGAGGDAHASLTLSSSAAINGSSYARSGRGGVDDYYGGGHSGDAWSSATGITSGDHGVSLTATSEADGGPWANGGGAWAGGYGQSDTGAVTLSASARGTSVDLNNTVAGRTAGALTLRQSAVANSADQYGGRAASALSLTGDQAASLTVSVNAEGGAGYPIRYLYSATGGDAISALSLTSQREDAVVNGAAYAAGGLAVNGGGASADATVLALGAARSLASAIGGGGNGYDDGSGVGGAASAVARATSNRDAAAYATANGGTADFGAITGHASARADSVTLLAGGVSQAHAAASGYNVDAAAKASGVGNASVTAVAEVRGDVQAQATAQSVAASRQADRSAGASAGAVLAHGGAASVTSAANFGGAGFALPDLASGVQALSQVNGAPDAATRAALLSQLPLTGAGAGAVVFGSGVQGASGIGPAPFYSMSSEFTFSTLADAHLQLGFLNTVYLGAGFDSLSLEISINGALLFARSFASLADANQFFTGHLLDLGPFGPGAQDLVLSSYLQAASGSGFAFDYYVAGSGLLAVVPEPGQWLMLLLGWGLLMVAARRPGRAGIS